MCSPVEQSLRTHLLCFVYPCKFFSYSAEVELQLLFSTVIQLLGSCLVQIIRVDIKFFLAHFVGFPKYQRPLKYSRFDLHFSSWTTFCYRNSENDGPNCELFICKKLWSKESWNHGESTILLQILFCKCFQSFFNRVRLSWFMWELICSHCEVVLPRQSREAAQENGGVT